MLDFHALRNTYITRLVASGASVKICQALARHSTPVLTIGLNAKLDVHDIRGAVERLEAFPTLSLDGGRRDVAGDGHKRTS